MIFLQWGMIGDNIFTSTAACFNFPIAFPNACMIVIGNDVGGGAHSIGISPFSAMQFNVYQQYNVTTVFEFLAIGK